MPAYSLGTNRTSGFQQQANKLKAASTEAGKWTTRQLARSSHSSLTRTRIAIICAAIFVSAVGVRLLHWQDSHIKLVAGKTALSGVFNRYRKEALRMLDEGGILFPREKPVAGDARLLAHPPGYSILLAAIYRVGGDGHKGLWLVQIACDAVAALLIFLIALELLNLWIALLAGMLVAVSPHLAYYSLLLSPDSLAVLPILLAVYLMAKALKRPKVTGIMLAGALIGVSCWLTANAMVLALFLGVAVLLLFQHGKRLMLAAVLVGSTIVVIAPLTIRNFVVFHRFIPLSIQAGLSLVEGIGDFDKEGKLGMPHNDREARQKDAEWSGRPDYFPSLWSPDGIERDRIRLDRGIAVVRSNPGWFLGVMARRAAFMLSYNDSRAREQPFNTATVPPISAEAGYGHAVEIVEDQDRLRSEESPVLVLDGEIISAGLAVKGDQPVTLIQPAELQAGGAVLSRSRVSLAAAAQAFEVVGDNSEYGDQFASAPIAVRKYTDYVLVLPIRLVSGRMAVKLTSSDRRTSLAVADLTYLTQETGSDDETGVDSTGARLMTTLQMPFASGNRTEVRVVMSNNGIGPVAPTSQLGTTGVFETGPTPYVWTTFARTIIRSAQRKFTTDRMLTLIAVGIALLLFARGGRKLMLLLVVPLYYLTLQSPLHTEYRYTLAIHYFLLVMAATSIYYALAAILTASWSVYGLARRRLAGSVQ